MTEPTPPASDAEPDTVTDPAWLREQYAKALDEAFSTFNPDETEDAYLTTHIVNTVMRVRDRHVEQLRQRLTLAEQVHRDDLAETERLRARLGSALACVKLLKIYANQIDHGRQVGGSDVASRIRHILTGLDDRPATEPRPA